MMLSFPNVLPLFLMCRPALLLNKPSLSGPSLGGPSLSGTARQSRQDSSLESPKEWTWRRSPSLTLLAAALIAALVVATPTAGAAQEMANVLPDTPEAPPPLSTASELIGGQQREDPSSRPDYRGWDFLAERLISIGLPQTEAATILSDPRMPVRSPVPFKLRPRETIQMYSSFTMEPRLRIARDCLAKHASAFTAAEHRFQVSKYVLAALLLVETQCGRFLGDQMVLNRLARVSSVGEPANIDFNLREHQKQDPTVTREQLVARAAYLEETFLPEVKALFEVAAKKGLDVFELRGSIAGAFGIPQFLPTSYLRYAIDQDGDGLPNLFVPADAIASAASYLHSFGWKDAASVEEKKKVLWHYNRSDAYGEAVLKVSILLRQSAAKKKLPSDASANKSTKAPAIKNQLPSPGLTVKRSP